MVRDRVRRDQRRQALDHARPPHARRAGRAAPAARASSSPSRLLPRRRGTTGINAGEIDALPRLVNCSITGFGDTGPLRDAPAIEWAVQATAGVTAEYLSDDDDPTRAGLAVVDAFSGFTAASSILGALLLRERTGEGSRLSTVAMFDAALGLLSAATTDAANGLPGRGLRLPGSGRFRARDRTLYVSCVHDKWFRGVCEVVGAPELADDPRFATRDGRAHNGTAFHAELAQRFAARDAGEWEQLLNARASRRRSCARSPRR